MKRNNVKSPLITTPLASRKKRDAHNIERQKLLAYVRNVWKHRKDHFAVTFRDLFTAVELAQGTGFSAVHLARELHRVGAQPVPRAKARKRLRDHEPQPQLWWLDTGPIPPHLSTVKDAWEEYELQKAEELLRTVKERVRGVVEAIPAASDVVRQ